MKDSEKRGLEVQQPTQQGDLESDHAAQPIAGVDETNRPPEESRSSREDSISESGALSPPVIDDEDPFALFPTLSVSMTSTRGPWMRRNTASTLGRQLTRAETLQTIKTVRSRFAEVRSEFDENVPVVTRFGT